MRFTRSDGSTFELPDADARLVYREIRENYLADTCAVIESKSADRCYAAWYNYLLQGTAIAECIGIDSFQS